MKQGSTCVFFFAVSENRKRRSVLMIGEVPENSSVPEQIVSARDGEVTLYSSSNNETRAYQMDEDAETEGNAGRSVVKRSESDLNGAVSEAKEGLLQAYDDNDEIGGLEDLLTKGNNGNANDENKRKKEKQQNKKTKSEIKMMLKALKMSSYSESTEKNFCSKSIASYGPPAAKEWAVSHAYLSRVPPPCSLPIPRQKVSFIA